MLQLPTQGTDIDATRTPGTPDVIAPSDIEYRPNCSSPSKAEDANYCQQRRAADIAERALHASNIQAWTSVGAANISLAALITAAFAARYAWQAGKANQRAADEAATTNKIARDTFLNEGRPYIFVESLSNNLIDWQSGIAAFEWNFRIINHGDKPAVINKVVAGVFLSANPPALRENMNYVGYNTEWGNIAFDQEKSLTSVVITGKNASAKIPRKLLRWIKDDPNAPQHLQLERKTIRDLLVRPYGIYVWLLGQVEYEDVFGRKLKTRFCFKLKPPFGEITEHAEPGYNLRS